MNVHEYQAKELLAKFGVGIPAGIAALTVEEAVAAAKQLPGPLPWSRRRSTPAVARASSRTAGRRQGRVRLAKSVEEVEAFAKEMLGNTLVTVQTGSRQAGEPPLRDRWRGHRQRILPVDGRRSRHRPRRHDRLDRRRHGHRGSRPFDPEKIATITIDPAQGFMPHHGRAVGYAEADGRPQQAGREDRAAALQRLHGAGLRHARNQPAGGNQGRQPARPRHQDELRSNALYRHPDVVALRDETEEDPAEIEASKYDLAYIKLDGNIGCMVNGAGLAMATMDIIKLNGEFPANFLDVGGGATTEKVTAAFKIILRDPAVKGILVNIFGGIMKCDIIADGIVAAAKEVNLQVPLVVRLEGTNVQQGKDILANSGLPIVPANDLGDAAQKIVAEVRKVS
jgi:succinyl-CoA synthetase beta subunit